MMPMLMLIVVSFFASAAGVIIWNRHEGVWAIALMGAFALALFISGALVLGGEFIREVRKRFHVG